jgi:Mn-dependent DtxR family transcriptional regulator
MREAPTSINQEDYLEQIAELIHAKGYARVSDIADRLGLGRPSVSVMIQRLDHLGYVCYERYRGVTLTSAGRRVANEIRARHSLLEDLFKALGLDPGVHLADIEGIEHHLSKETLERFRVLVNHLRDHPLPEN